jgi:hypothetical protein
MTLGPCLHFSLLSFSCQDSESGIPIYPNRRFTEHLFGFPRNQLSELDVDTNRKDHDRYDFFGIYSGTPNQSQNSNPAYNLALLITHHDAPRKSWTKNSQLSHRIPISEKM